MDIFVWLVEADFQVRLVKRGWGRGRVDDDTKTLQMDQWNIFEVAAAVAM